MTKLIVKKSRIAGLGLWAGQKIRKGQKIIEYIGEKINKIEAKKRERAKKDTYLFYLNSHYDIDAMNVYNEARYANHCCLPNAQVKYKGNHIYIYALKTIQKGTEITFDYELISPKIIKCKCGAINCRGYQNETDKIKKLKRKQYANRRLVHTSKKN